ncbi:aldo/keto reductase [Companilactobacillus sp.]|jgi:aryl-alcohol dehydrogenase-like predicted oxidoreductase|uniref:aldo/keto reductase n=1 Tax=Companilactobacillus sp. TaxID=2767905 RepID=UPI0025C0DA11|nr:aldo/keto reductase [Companilactobacillus sp.]MCH4010038.1 aldo/keto reductase [Companilactobacillus sp.]MCH4052286.1 aldo/keto reductase [Companilactobacillus sp.]MCH4077980.1 aldo/keto reductase [Companilactobacillus sp.]MCH4126556.1 aldo/keto reductase [Companilactobacillus sp.]MCH4132142.1 aldo/keto reductase [Companilactobacillus sp.]
MDNLIKIGNTDVTSKKIGLGTNKVGGHNIFKNLKDEDGYAVVKEAIDKGITTLDTAYMYGEGRSEEIIGDVIQNYDRSKLVIATKAAQNPEKDNAIDNSPEFLKKAVDDALKRLKTDYIDIFYIHFPDENTPKDEAVAALNELKKAGKIKAIGLSNFSLDQIKEANKDGLVDIVEDNYSLVHREAETKLFPYLRKNKISFVPYFPLASGLLTGKYNSGDAKKFDQFSKEQFSDIMDALGVVHKVAQATNSTDAQVVLAWYMKNPDISIVIPGARIPEQVDQNAKALDVEIRNSSYHAIDEAFSEFA